MGSFLFAKIRYFGYSTAHMSIHIRENYPLASITSFKIGGPAKYFTEVTSTQEVVEAFDYAKENQLEVLLIGGASNMLVSDNGFDGLVIKMNLRGKELLINQDSDEKKIYIKVAAGENWDNFVQHCVDQRWWGIENLSLIPGNVGSVPIQNVGAYGQEASQVVESVEVYDRQTGEVKALKNADCGFSYRKSIFNSSEKGRYVVLYVTFQLSREGQPYLGYPDVQKYFEQEDKVPSLENIRKAIIEIRQRKLPNPAQIGNSGSFFKNVQITEEQYENLKKKFLENFSEQDVEVLEELKQKFCFEGVIKIPTAFLIDRSGLKGIQVGGASIHQNQPLVIVNTTGNATASDVLNLFKKVRQAVYAKTGLEIANEPELIGFTDEELKNYFELS